MADQDLDRSETATAHKLLDARKRGQVARSSDVTAAVVFTAAVTYLYGRGWDSAQELFRFDRSLFSYADRLDANLEVMTAFLDHAIKGTLLWLAPFFATIMLAAVVANLVQTGAVLSTDPITPDFDRLNPASGLRKILSRRSLFELARSCLKLALLGLVVYQALKGLLPHFLNLSALSPSGYARTLLDDTASLGLKMAAMLGFIALVDAIYGRREFAAKMRMSKREVRDEHKRHEGDPRIRSRMRELQRDLLKRSASLSQTRNADVLITNPSHVAVALRYRHGEMVSPQLVAKGAGVLAFAMRKIAARHQIPIVQNRRLARKLFHQVDMEQHVPATLYAEVARIIVWVFAMREARRHAAGAGTAA